MKNASLLQYGMGIRNSASVAGRVIYGIGARFMTDEQIQAYRDKMQSGIDKKEEGRKKEPKPDGSKAG